MSKVESVEVEEYQKETIYYRKVNSLDSIKLSLLIKEENKFIEVSRTTTCKDYIGDAIYHNLLGTLGSFTSLDTIKTLKLKDFIFKMRVRNKDDVESVISNFKMINKLEKKVGIPLSKIYRVSGIDDEVVIDADKFYLQSPLTSSILLQLVRFLPYPVDKKYRKIENHIKAVSVSVGNRDGRISKNIVRANIDFVHLLSNIDRVLGTNKITGFCDALVLKTPKSVSWSIDKTYSVYKDSKVYTKEVVHNNNHSLSGIENFSLRLFNLMNTPNWKESVTLSTGSDWHFNYFKLLNWYDKLDV